MRHAEIFGSDQELEPVIVEALRASHRDDKKEAKALAELHVERALSFNRARLAALLQRLPSYEADAAAIRAIAPRPTPKTSKSWGEELYAVGARLMEAELAARPEPEPALEREAAAAGRAWIGVTVWPAELKGIRWWGEATDLGSACQTAAETAGRLDAWLAWPDEAAAAARVASLKPPSFEAYLGALEGR
ncbi:MAG: hypothetical protein KF901_28685 [Myxococcales bacterium]|nr:hypothetical protein [Myxococcales bacterium]